ncbi:MAG: solute carrier family 26 protein [Anaerolineae bacterium]|nr:solute carrier family 26 protein [Anaerolineae bacterium]
MAPVDTNPATKKQIKNDGNLLTKYVPLLSWGRSYQKEWLTGDLLAGLIVAIMLVPQGMAYALLAGLPAQVGLYASIFPLLIYGLLGSSRVLAVGPVAIVSIMVAGAVGAIAEPGTAVYLQMALTLAFLAGLIQALMGLFRLGFLVNFLSHPVLAGFTSAAAIVIGFSQLKHLLGLSTPQLDFINTITYTSHHIAETNMTTLVIGLTGIIVLVYFKYALGGQLKRLGLPNHIRIPLTKSGPLVIVLLGTLAVLFLGLNQTASVKVVGEVPAGLPPLTIPSFDLSVWRTLLPTALTISFVGFMESFSVAKSLASKKRQHVESNQELFGLGMANLGAAFTGGYPVTGGFSRSVVNYEAGANTGLASIITAVLMALAVIFLTPLFYYLPQALLAAIILVAVVGLIDIKSFRHIWAYNKVDGISMIITFFSVLAVGIEAGILVGVAAAILLFVWRTSRPHVAIVGRMGNSQVYRNVLRHEVQTCPTAIAMRVDESLYFANTKYLEDTILAQVADNPEVNHLVLIATAVNFIDASALETLETLQAELRDSGVELHLAGIKGPVMDRLKQIGFVDHFGPQYIHFRTHDAMAAIGCLPE